MKKIYAIYQCRRDEFIKAAKDGVKLSGMPFRVNASVVFCVESMDSALADCRTWNNGTGKDYLTTNWFINVDLYK